MALEPGVGAEQFQIKRMMLASRKYALGATVPAVIVLVGPGVCHDTLQNGIDLSQEGIVSRDSPFTVAFHDFAECAVHAGAIIAGNCLEAQWQFQAEVEPVIFIHSEFQVR